MATAACQLSHGLDIFYWHTYITVIGDALAKRSEGNGMAGAPGEWSPADATKRINACARDRLLDLSLTEHAQQRLIERDLLTADLLHVLKTGFVYEKPEPSTQAGFFKYCIEGKSPNSGNRILRAIVIPDGRTELKVVTIMWRDE